tara:strand:- start:3813 stop:4073 length:261 start_codon:yes stop_codon:yes gene_type:complete
MSMLTAKEKEIMAKERKIRPDRTSNCIPDGDDQQLRLLAHLVKLTAMQYEDNSTNQEIDDATNAAEEEADRVLRVLAFDPNDEDEG